MKKQWLAGILCAAMCVSLSGCSTAESVETAAGEQIIYAQITSINGNEITYAVAEQITLGTDAAENADEDGEETSLEESRNFENAESQESNASQEIGAFPDGEMPQRGEMPQGGMAPGGNRSEDGSMPDMEGMSMPDMNDMEGMSMPDMGDMEGMSMPDMSDMEGMSMPDMGDMEGMSMPDMSDTEGQRGRGQRGDGSQSEIANLSGDSQDQVMYTLTGETVTTLIPVGTVVTTQLGTETTFSRLAVGDMLKIKLGTNDAGETVILAIWIVG